MEKLLQAFLSKKSDIDFTEIVLFTARQQPETLYLERDIMKQIAPINDTCLQLNTEMINHCQKAIRNFENVLEKQK